jgi:dipeptidyl aminopeptidase/acylaminoacyl peptidase
MNHILGRSCIAFFLLLSFAALPAQEKRAMDVVDIMKFEQLSSPSISKDGRWVAHAAVPDRGDPRVLVYSTNGNAQYELAGARSPVISGNGKWVAAVLAVPASELLVSDKGKDGGPKTGLILLNTQSGVQTRVDSIQSFTFSNDGNLLAAMYHADNKKKNGSKEKEPEGLTPGNTLNLWDLEEGSKREIPYVTNFAFDSISRHLAYVVADTGAGGNGIYVLDLEDPDPRPLTLFADSSAWGSDLAWNNPRGQLAFLAGIAGKDGKKEATGLWLWEPGETRAMAALNDGELEDGWRIWHSNSLQWSRDGLRLFLGIKPESEILPPEEEKPDSLKNLYSTEDILAGKQVDIWHWNDPYINPQQKIRWKEEKDRTYTGVYYPDKDQFVPLSDPEMPEIRISDNPRRVLGSSNIPYAKMVTWDGSYRDYYRVDLESGKRKLALEKHQGRPSLSPDGEFLVWYEAGDWYLLNASTGESRNLTAGLPVTFADEDWDYPEDTPGYGVADWLDASEAVLIYDKYDIWQFPVDGSEALCLTEGKGRAENLQFRIRRLDRDQPFLESGENLVLTAYHDLKKYTALYSMEAGRTGVELLAEGPHKYTPVAKAEEADKLLFTRQSYTEFPDLWVSGTKFNKPLKLSDLNSQTGEFAWGEAELVEWSSMDGTPLQGILIKPGNYEAGKKYPVLVYYYRFFSNRLYDFNRVELTHRPCFPYYASHGYAIFLPDIRFDVGNPGYSATKCLVPGVQKIIDMGVADPEAICLHGHSWSGYQTAFAITQTDIFACAIAGAPVSNMTSAYSGIRWGSGLARQFQYEKSQSRIGGSLWEARDKYIENSPVFFADRIETPLLIMFGDEDDAVPWYQGIELYLAMRRLGKDCIFLQYRKEPHHPKTYANKLDCTLRYKEYLDHYLKKEPAAEWISKGIPYTGK